jgi:hypothetical protein
MVQALIYLRSLNEMKYFQMFAEYDENEIGALDCEEIEGELNPEDDMVLRLAQEEFDKRSKVGYSWTSLNLFRVESFV